jgi:NAD(P)-dependent dehydrogenase (short-subunit alcohol dehydrogenase family)
MSSSAKFLADRVAIVTASTKGIGFAIAQRLGLDGASVVVSSRQQKHVQVRQYFSLYLKVLIEAAFFILKLFLSGLFLV